MSIQKPSLPKGTRDFGPEKMVRRNFIFDTIKTVFKKFGFMQLETPSMENLSVLTGKYGDEGDQLIFKILNSGDFLTDVRAQSASLEEPKSVLPLISEKALRYDLTVPFARFVVMNRNEITFPFKRFQIQPVWRADRPQRGRYREFYQCDADVVGTNSLLCEAEIVLMMDEVLSNLGITDFTIKVNNRKILSGIAEAVGEAGKESTICVAIDKLDKIGQEGVNKELLERGISESAVAQLPALLQINGETFQRLEKMKTALVASEIGQKGVDELSEVFEYLSNFELRNAKIELDATLARGLSYYTGTIIEVKVNNVSIGSISGGGRYDNLTGVFGMPDVPGVGFSFGVDRIYDVMEELNLFPDSVQSTTQVLLIAFDKEAEKFALKALAQLRANNIAAELYPDGVKIKKQMSYADSKKIPFVGLIGSDEVANQKIAFKNMTSGEQTSFSIEQILNQFNS
jgi:histidyl-tRNA synthetase